MIDSRFQVEGICSNQGDMGQILFIKDISKHIKGQTACYKEIKKTSLQKKLD